MQRIMLVAVATFSLPLAGSASAQNNSGPPADEAARFVTNIIDKFNGGDIKAWLSAQQDDTLIVDDFAPHMWTGAGSAQRWLDAYAKQAKDNGVSGGRVDYGKPLHAASDGKTAYVVLPTTYRFVQKGTKMAEPSSMTFVMNRAGDSWKIASWTFSAAAAAAPEK